MVWIETLRQYRFRFKFAKPVEFCKKNSFNLHILSEFAFPASVSVFSCLCSVCFETRPGSHGVITSSFPPTAPSSKHPDEGLLNSRSSIYLTVSHSGRFLLELPKNTKHKSVNQNENLLNLVILKINSTCKIEYLWIYTFLSLAFL